MKNTAKLKTMLQLYTIHLDMDDDDRYIFTMTNKRNGATETFADKSYSVVIAKGFGYMKREMKFKSSPGSPL